MSRNITWASVALIVLILIGYTVWHKTASNPLLSSHTNSSQYMKISSTQFENNGSIPSKFTCDGANVSPELEISRVPENAKNLALIVDDPDAPAGTWVHWVVWNIDPKTTVISENSLPAGALQGNTSFGKPGYGGPCPPSGTHHYHFKLYALDITLALPVSTDKAGLEKAMDGHIIDRGEYIGVYSHMK